MRIVIKCKKNIEIQNIGLVSKYLNNHNLCCNEMLNALWQMIVSIIVIIKYCNNFISLSINILYILTFRINSE